MQGRLLAPGPAACAETPKFIGVVKHHRQLCAIRLSHVRWLAAGHFYGLTLNTNGRGHNGKRTYSEWDGEEGGFSHIAMAATISLDRVAKQTYSAPSDQNR